MFVAAASGSSGCLEMRSRGSPTRRATVSQAAMRGPSLQSPTLFGSTWSKITGSRPSRCSSWGGDQLYADELWESRRAPSIAAWSELDRKQRIKRAAGPRLHGQLDRFYEDLYLRHWNQEEMSLMMASIPSIMMWDDHDIFDGWGSYPRDLQTCPVYKAVFGAARKYFELFQIRSNANTALLNGGSGHYSFGIRFRGYGILGLDNRSNRTDKVVMNAQNWSDVKNWLSANSGRHRTLLVLSAVPVVYRDFGRSETILELTPWEEELSDDIRDQWRSKHHEGERMRLIMNLLNFRTRSQPSDGKTVILSVDVHVGCLDVIRDQRNPLATRRIYQVVSSPIVHPAPTWIQWRGVVAGSNDDPESLDDGQIVTEIIMPYGADDKFLRTRNYVTLQEGNDSKLWVNWICESGIAPVYVIEGS